MEETKKISEKKKKNEKQALQELINAQETMNATTPPTDQAVRNYEEAQERFQLQLAKRQQAASDINFTNFATLRERTSRYHFSRSNRGKTSREIPRLVIEDEQGQVALEGSELKQHMFNKYKQICQPDDNVGTLTIQQFLGP